MRTPVRAYVKVAKIERMEEVVDIAGHYRIMPLKWGNFGTAFA